MKIIYRKPAPPFSQRGSGRLGISPCRKPANEVSARNRGFLGSEATEWWYWMKEKQGRPEMWEAAKDVFQP
ncbi:MAG: hypothetical protein HYU04_01675 [Candidatus Wildermuthbacteria bacterium]|nr:hypothetical protein [Candidatus Wildermuthbacteria bacterium]